MSLLPAEPRIWDVCRVFAVESMANPAPENIEGVKTETAEYKHIVNHEINWSYVALGAVVLAGLWFLHTHLRDDSTEEETEQAAVGGAQSAEESPAIVYEGDGEGGLTSPF